jgi:hypothetical protein
MDRRHSNGNVREKSIKIDLKASEEERNVYKLSVVSIEMVV